MRYVVKLWKAWTGWKYTSKFSKFNFLQCFKPKEWEKVVVYIIFSVWEDSTIVWVSLMSIYIIKRNSCLYVRPPLSWPYLWTDFETKGTYGLPMTQGWIQKYKILKFRKIKNFFFQISLLECLFPPRMPNFVKQKFPS